MAGAAASTAAGSISGEDTMRMAAPIPHFGGEERRQPHRQGDHGPADRDVPAVSLVIAWSWCPLVQGPLGDPVPTDHIRRSSIRLLMYLPRTGAWRGSVQASGS